jgi:hypothetical protein
MPVTRSTALSGVRSGCSELFANEPIRTISDLRGKKIGIDRLGSSAHLLLMAVQVGLDPQGYRLDHEPHRQVHDLFATDRSRHPQHGRGPTLVGIFLLAEALV